MKVLSGFAGVVFMAAVGCGCRCAEEACPPIAAESSDAESEESVESGATPPEFFTANAITEVRYVKVAMHDADPEPKTVLKLSELSERESLLLAKADCGSWEREYADDRVCDGMRWVVEFVSGRKVVKRVDGFNAEPEGLRYLLEAAGLSRPRELKFDDE